MKVTIDPHNLNNYFKTPSKYMMVFYINIYIPLHHLLIIIQSKKFIFFLEREEYNEKKDQVGKYTPDLDMVKA